MTVATEDSSWNAEIVEDRTTIFLTALQGEEGLSADEIAFGVINALQDWVYASNGVARRGFVDQLFDIAARTHLSEPVELPLQEMLATAVQRENWKTEERSAK